MLGESVDSGFAVGASPLRRHRVLILDVSKGGPADRGADPCGARSGGSVVNVGAGTGNYEPADRTVVAVDPSVRMLLQREQRSRLVVRAFAERLPFPDRVFGAALAVFTMQHWDDCRAGRRELRRATARSTNNCTAALVLGSPASGSGQRERQPDHPRPKTSGATGRSAAEPWVPNATPSFVQE